MKKLKNFLRSNVEYNYIFATFFLITILCAVIYSVLNLSFQNLLISYFIHFFIITFGVGYGLHRLTIHRVSRTNDWVKRAACLVGVLSNTSSPVLWAGSHYIHHRKSDELGKDPHTPKLGTKVLFGFYDVKALEKEKREMMSALRLISRDPYLKFIHNWYYLILIGWWLFLGIFGFDVMFWYGLVPSAMSFYGLMVQNFFTHISCVTGYKSHDTKDESLNVPLVWFATFGENWHNNHHHNATAKTTKEKWWEIDVIYFWVWLFDLDLWDKRKLKFKMFKKMISNFWKKEKDFIY